MGANLGADPILQRGDDFAAGRIVFWIGGEEHHHVQRQPNREALDLNIAFLKDVEQTDLNFPCQIRQFVDGEESPVGARHETEVHGQLAGELQASVRGFDGVDVADHVGDGDIGRRQLLDVARLARQPVDGHGVTVGRNALAPVGGERRQGVVVDFAPGNDRNGLVQERRQGPENPRLRLTAQAEQDEIVPGQNRVDDLRDDGLFVANDPRKQWFPLTELGDQILAHFVLHTTWTIRPGGDRRFE